MAATDCLCPQAQVDPVQQQGRWQSSSPQHQHQVGGRLHQETRQRRQGQGPGGAGSGEGGKELEEGEAGPSKGCVAGSTEGVPSAPADPRGLGGRAQRGRGTFQSKQRGQAEALSPAAAVPASGSALANSCSVVAVQVGHLHGSFHIDSYLQAAGKGPPPACVELEDGRRLTPNQAEEAGGCGSNKKWRFSIRVVGQDGSAKPIGPFLVQRPPITDAPGPGQDRADLAAAAAPVPAPALPPVPPEDKAGRGVRTRGQRPAAGAPQVSRTWDGDPTHQQDARVAHG